jgi:hypothetical protein
MKRLLGKPRRRWGDNFKMDLRETQLVHKRVEWQLFYIGMNHVQNTGQVKVNVNTGEVSEGWRVKGGRGGGYYILVQKVSCLIPDHIWPVIHSTIS